jgi:hypothetical protein
VHPYTLHAFLWKDGRMHDLNDLVKNLPANVELATAEAINEDGVIVGKACSSYCSPGKTARSHGYVLVPDGMSVPTPQPTLQDTSGRALKVTVAGTPPTAAKGRWGDGLHFSAGRLLAAHTEIPLQNWMIAWVRPDTNAKGQGMIVGQWKERSTRGDGGAIAKLVYDGDQRRIVYSVVDAQGRTAVAASLPGSFDGATTKPLLVGGGVRKSGEVVVAIEGRMYSSGQYVKSIDTGDGVTPLSVGATAEGDQPFAGIIEGAAISPGGAPNANYRLPWWEYSPQGVLVYFFYDADQAVPDLNDLDFPPSPNAPAPGPNDSQSPAPTPTSATTPTPTATPSPSPSPTPSPSPSPTPSPSPSPTSTPTPSPSPTATPTPGPVWAPPTPVITAPASYSWSRSSTLTMSGTAQAGAIVEVFDGTTLFGTTTATVGGTWTRSITLPGEGAYLLTAKARNLGGASPSSALRVIQVDSLAPAAPQITAPATAAATSFTLSGTAEPGTTVEVFENSSSRGTVAATNGNWTKSFSAVVPGARSYTAIATDMAGNRSAMSLTRTLSIG